MPLFQIWDLWWAYHEAHAQKLLFHLYFSLIYCYFPSFVPFVVLFVLFVIYFIPFVICINKCP
jgi:hypothetical protein